MVTQNATEEFPVRRVERRIAVHLPIRVRGQDSSGVRFEELTASVNVSRAGTAFATRHPLAPGAEVEIHIPLPRQGQEPEGDFSTRGRVVHVRPGNETGEQIVGVNFTGRRFPRVFSRETSN